MAHSVIVSNIPLEVSNVTVLKFLQLNDITVEHIQSFPDEYHHINEAAQTKTLQLFTTTEQAKHRVSDLFTRSSTIDQLIEIERLSAKGPGSGLGAAGEGSAVVGHGSGRRISVTIL